MANQINPNTFAMMCRVPLRDVAAIRKRARRASVGQFGTGRIERPIDAEVLLVARCGHCAS